MRARLLPLLLLAVVAAGCDTTDGLRLDAEFYVGSWTLAAISDDSGDRTAEVSALLDDIAAGFEADGDFSLTVDFAPAVNDAGQDDVTVLGTYQAQPDLRTLVLRVSTAQGTVAPTFLVDAESESRIDLVAPAAVVELLLGQLEIDFEGDVRLGLRKL